VADHLRAATFLIAEGVSPSNVERGYVCRRLIRRAVRNGHELGIDGAFTTEIAQMVIQQFGQSYPELRRQQVTILSGLEREEERFRGTLVRGLREFQKQETALRVKGASILGGETIFHLFDTFGFPPTLSAELAQERGLSADLEGFDHFFKQHQECSRRERWHSSVSATLMW
jgi:alanyl-tRNA synthetase